MFKVLDSAVPVACWSCSIGHNDSTLFCPHCSKIQPPPGGDYFSVFGLEPRLNLDLRRAGARVSSPEPQAASRPLCPRSGERKAVEPGRHGAAQRRLSHSERSAAPHRIPAQAGRRGDWRGAQRQGSQRPLANVPADLLEEVFELNMQLEEMRMARKMGEQTLRSKRAWSRQKKSSTACWKRWTRICAPSGRHGTRASNAARACCAKKRWWPCSTGGATSAIWSAT